MSKVQNHFQTLYDGLMDFADRSYNNSQISELKQFGLSQEWYGQSSAYEYAATMLCGSCSLEGIFLKTRQSKRQQEIDAGNREELSSSCEQSIQMDIHG